MGYTIRRFENLPQGLWNDFVDRSDNGTIFHRLDFLAYHGERFRNEAHPLSILKGESLFGVMPMALFTDEEGRRTAKSPFGASYGGPVFAEPLEYDTSRQVVTALLDYLRGQTVSQLVLTLPIAPCYRRYCETFRLALLEAGFACTNRDISSAVLLTGAPEVSQLVTSRARNMARKAEKCGVRIVSKAPLEDFWKAMDATFAKHGRPPTHTFEQFQALNKTFPDRIYADVAYLEQTPVAGVGYFVLNERANSSFYLCQDPAHQSCQAQSRIILHALEQSKQGGFTWFDFGTSSANMRGGENIFRFKESFGALGYFRETYTWQAT